LFVHLVQSVACLLVCLFVRTFKMKLIHV
jgi:hypothetical protein